jgi:hypothetical protein
MEILRCIAGCSHLAIRRSEYIKEDLDIYNLND